MKATLTSCHYSPSSPGPPHVLFERTVCYPDGAPASLQYGGLPFLPLLMVEANFPSLIETERCLGVNVLKYFTLGMILGK